MVKIWRPFSGIRLGIGLIKINVGGFGYLYIFIKSSVFRGLHMCQPHPPTLNQELTNSGIFYGLIAHILVFGPSRMDLLKI